MNHSFSPPSDIEPAPVFSAVIECNTFHVHLVPALFELFRREAVLAGFEDVDNIKVKLTLEVSGSMRTEHDFGALHDRIDTLWVGAHCYPAQREKR